MRPIRLAALSAAPPRRHPAPGAGRLRQHARGLSDARHAGLARARWASGPTNIHTGDGPVSVVAGDFNGDQDSDLAVANEFSDNLSVLLRRRWGAASAPRPTAHR